MGRVPGFDPRSYCAEGSSATCLSTGCGHVQLILLQTMYCNNLGLVTKDNKLLSFCLASMQVALHSEFDALATIHDLLQDFPLPPEIQHVKGHQDNRMAYEDLSLPAQLHYDADVLATGKLKNFLTTCTHVPLLPPAIVQLTIGGTTVTRKVDPTIRCQHSLRLPKAYMHEGFCWMNGIIYRPLSGIATCYLETMT
jgi:hypothetical protein